MKTYSRVCAKINLDYITHNIEQLKNNLSEEAQIMAVVKADGYGYGSLAVAKELEKVPYLWGYAVATQEEAMLLRKGEVMNPILVLGCIFPEQYYEAIENNIQFTVYTEESAKQISKLAMKLDKKARIHIKLDTGLARIGFRTNQKDIQIIQRISKMEGLEMEGLYTHFASAGKENQEVVDEQLNKFLWMKEQLLNLGISFPYYHCANSSAIIEQPETSLNLVRAGTAIYGIYPSTQVKRDVVKLKPALSILSHAICVKWVETGTKVGYGGCFKTNRRTKIVTIPVGYSDGYPRSLSNKGEVLIHGRRAPIIGNICMDQLMVDATGIENVKFGDEVTLLGKNGEEEISMDEICELSERSYNDVMGSVGKRVPREYIKSGHVVNQVDTF